MNQIIILDVRQNTDYQQDHLPNAINIPVQQLAEKAYAAIPDIHATIFVYCSTGRNSKTAQSILKHKGYQNVYNLGALSGLQ